MDGEDHFSVNIANIKMNHPKTIPLLDVPQSPEGDTGGAQYPQRILPSARRHSKRKLTSGTSGGQRQSRTSAMFFRDSAAPGPFMPVKLDDVRRVLNDDENHRRYAAPEREKPPGIGAVERSGGSPIFPDFQEVKQKKPSLAKFLSTSCQQKKAVFYSLELIVGVSLMILSLLMLNLKASYSLFEFKSFDRLEVSAEILRWFGLSIWMCGSYFTGMGCLGLLSSLVALVQRISRGHISHRLKDELDYFLNLRPYIILAVVLGFGVLLGNELFKEQVLSAESLSKGGRLSSVLAPEELIERTWQYYCRRTMIAAFLFSAVLVAERWIIQRISIAFHRINYKDRVEENNTKLGILMTLKKYALKKCPIPLGEAISGIFSNISRIRADYSPSHLASHDHPSPSSLWTSSEDDDMIADEATELATEIMIALKSSANKCADEPKDDSDNEDDSKDSGRLHLVPHDFMSVFEREDAIVAFEFLDKDGNLDLTLEELADSIVETFKQRSSLLKSLVENEAIIKQLDTLFKTLAMALFVTIVLPVYSVPTKSLAAFGTLFFGLSFVFGSSAATLLQSIVFIFISHPYDIGDRVTFDSFAEITVHEIGLMATTFLQDDGQLVYIPNSQLFSKAIFNVRRSFPQSETINFEIPLNDGHGAEDQVMRKLYSFKRKVGEFLSTNSRDFYTPNDFFTFDLAGSSKIQASIRLGHKSNFQDHQQKWARRERFNIFLVDQLKAFNF